MRYAVLECDFPAQAGQKAVDDTGGERVTTTAPVEDLNVLGELPFDGTPAGEADTSSAVETRGPCAPKTGCDDLQVWVVGADAGEKARVALGVKSLIGRAGSFDLVPKRRVEVLLVAEHHVNEPCKPPVHPDRALGTSDRLPDRRPVVEVVGDNSA